MIIALCGNPGAGKSEVQLILARLYAAQPVDDGRPMRDFAIRHLGAKEEDVYTQEGKKRLVRLPGGKLMLWREFLGEFGNHIEALLGPYAIPEMALLRIDQSKHHSFGSVRGAQGIVYQRAGGLVVGVESAWATPSAHEFDRFDRSRVQIWIESKTKDLAALEQQIIDKLGPHFA